MERAVFVPTGDCLRSCLRHVHSSILEQLSVCVVLLSRDQMEEGTSTAEGRCGLMMAQNQHGRLVLVAAGWKSSGGDQWRSRRAVVVRPIIFTAVLHLQSSRQFGGENRCQSLPCILAKRTSEPSVKLLSLSPFVHVSYHTLNTGHGRFDRNNLLDSI